MEFSSSLVYNIMKWRINMRNEKIDLSRLPMHVGIIMDGNGTGKQAHLQKIMDIKGG